MEIRLGSQPLGTIVNHLTQGKIQPDAIAHLDPDLNRDSIPRQVDLKPVFGQAGIAERHLQKEGVSEGDLFLFYGWFRQAEQVAGRYRYVQGAPDPHVILVTIYLYDPTLTNGLDLPISETQPC